jgi:non-heme chloroperoxidase
MTTEAKLLSHRVRLRTGVTLRCLERPGAGETVLLLHGYSDSARSHEPLLPFLPPDWRVLAPDQRGHGDSERPAAGYAMADLAADAAALLDAASAAGPVTVVGHSMGSFVAQQLAVAHPERVARLVLVGSGPRADAAALPELVREVHALRDPVPEEFVRAFQASALHRPLPDADFARVIAESCKLPARVWQALLDGIFAYELAGAVGCPTLLVWGAHDAMFGRAGQDALLRAIPGARLVVYAGSGHCPNWEEPARFGRDLAAFVAG